MLIPDSKLFADVILPLAAPGLYTYRVPEELGQQVRNGQVAIVQFGMKHFYSAVIFRIHSNEPETFQPKFIQALMNEQPVVNEVQLKLWDWLQRYYLATHGEVMTAALPALFKLSSETKITLEDADFYSLQNLDDSEFLVAEALSLKQELPLSEIKKILQKKDVYPVVKGLLEKGVVSIHEEFKDEYKPKFVSHIELAEPFASEEDLLNKAFENLQRAKQQQELLDFFLQSTELEKRILKQDLLNRSGKTTAALKGLTDKKILREVKVETSRLETFSYQSYKQYKLTEIQEKAFHEVKEKFEEHMVVLLHGVTGSGKTHIYIKLIEEILAQGRQVLYLLPEIALTAQLSGRLRQTFGNDIGIYHSGFSDRERVEIWKKVQSKEYKIILGARSATFLPFENLGLIIIDEEHDSSYKQFDPAPRYHARDTAIFLAHLCDAKVLLGSATPALESYYNTETKKYGLVTLLQRHGEAVMPEIKPVDLKEQHRWGTMKMHFSSTLLKHIDEAVQKQEQVILFQNRRGYAPVVNCQSCGWHPGCPNCDISLTYHKFSHSLRCHYCGHRSAMPGSCPSCNQSALNITGLGTEKVEDDLAQVFPHLKVARFDQDSTGRKGSSGQIISRFANKEIDVLIGTQMVTKGLDFDNVTLVGILSADQLMRFPDFRSHERAFQLMCQVSGRAGRKIKKGTVLIQTFDPQHELLKDVIQNDYKKFYYREMWQRKQFHYPPFVRLIRITLKHKEFDVLNKGSAEYSKLLMKRINRKSILGPVFPSVAKVRGYYLKEIVLKLEKKQGVVENAKEAVRAAADELRLLKDFRSVSVHPDVDT